MFNYLYWLIIVISFSFNPPKTVVVAQDGSGDFTQIQAAIESLRHRADVSQTATILIKKGTYREKIFLDIPNLILRGVSAPSKGMPWATPEKANNDDTPLIIFSESREIYRCDKPDDWGAATMNIRSHDITLENLIVVNDFGFAAKTDSTFICKGTAKLTRRDGHQFALRCMPPTQRLTVKNCNFHALGGDTVSPWDVDNGTFHFRNCTMEGGVDFYCPRGWAYAESCVFICHNLNAAIWHDGTGNESAKTVLKNCVFIGDKGFKLGRFHRDAQFYLINCQFSKDMADEDIYQVRKDTQLVWGKRVNYFNCHRIGGNFNWHQNNLDKELAQQINRDWTLKARWDLPLQASKNRSDYALPKVADAPMLKPATDSVAERILIAQRKYGGWPKTIDGKTQPPQYFQSWTPSFTAAVADDFGRNDATIDNGSTNREIRYLSKAFNQTQNEKYKAAAERGIAYLLKMPYENGGFPQFFPDTNGYRQHITFNDNAMVNCLTSLKAIAEKDEPFEKVGETYRSDAQKAVERGIDIILKTQVVSKGRLTVWCAQHDHRSLAPAKARAYELPSLSGKESVGILEFLMTLKKPTPSVKQAIEAGIAFLDSVKITGFTVKDIKDKKQPSGRDRVLVKDPQAIIWARFYDLDSHKPFFCGRDGIKKNHLAEIENERRIGYAYYISDAQSLLEKKYPKWKKMIAKP
jgi:PelA/Pel-15E family pectate lyase